jgi:hypothetical protein
MMNSKMRRVLFTSALVICLAFLFGCEMAYDMAVTGAGSSAKIEQINFFKTSNDFTKGGSGLPDLYYISPNVNWNKYKTVMVPNFTSISTDVSKVSSLQITEFKNLRQDIPDNIQKTFDGNVFPKCMRLTAPVSHSNQSSVRRLHADAILFGNISENKSGIRNKRGTMLTTTQVEIKLVDRKTGQEIVKMISRSSTDSDKVSMPIVRLVANLMSKAKQ